YLRTTTKQTSSFSTRIVEQSSSRFRPIFAESLGSMTDMKTNSSDIYRYLSKQLGRSQ
ncbi:hypothetical protein L917_01944, partial [Phytophthora nicotianae]